MPDDTPPPDLKAELRQRLPFRNQGHEAVVGLARSASVLDRAVACLLRPYGLSGAQYNVLRILQGAVPKGLPTLGIRDRMIDPAAAVTRLVDKLEQAGLVRRERVGTDRRQVLVHITPLGLDKLAELDPLVSAVDAGVTAALSDAELQEFNRLLGLVRAALAHGETRGEGEKGRRGEGLASSS